MMKTYQSYNPSDVFWYDQIPQGWSITKNKFILKEQKDIVDEDWNQYQLLSLTKVGVIVRDLENSKGKFPEFFNSYKIIRKNDLIFCLYDIEETPRTIGLSGLDGMITGSYNVFQTNQVPKFIYYWYLTIDDVKGLKPFYTGMRNVVRNETFMSLKIFTPPLHEQQQIVKFLDEKTSIIDKLISTKERKIELLKEQRSSLINEVITKGLDPNVKMKDSGVEWIGEIPVGWDVIKLKNLVETNKRVLPENTDQNYELQYIEIGDVNSLGELKNFTNYIFSESPSRCRRILSKGDVFISTVRTYLKSIGYIKDEVSDLICSTGFCVLTPKSEILSQFLFYQVLTEFFIGEVISTSKGVSYPSITSTELVNIKVVKPTLKEQQHIVEYLDIHTKEIDDLVQFEQRKIEILKEYRQSLISEVITGKIKVVE